MTTGTQARSRQEKVREAHTVLTHHLQALAEQMRQGKSEALLRYLEFSARFHQYSFCNVLLILAQKPDATRVAGLRLWNQMGRYVKPGEKGIMIFAPMRVKKRPNANEPPPDPENDEAELLTLFKVVYVFDVSQTDGADLPDLLHTQGDAGALYPALQRAVRGCGITLEHVAVIPGSPTALGASYDGRIAVRDGLEPAEGFRTLAHELAHERLHWRKDTDKESKTIRELEADGTAYVVCRHFGLHTDSADYLLLYDATPEVLLARLESICQTAAEIIGLVENELQGATRQSD
jgi:antirestriction protein ArdC